MITNLHANYENKGVWIISFLWLAFCFTQMVNFSIDKYICHGLWFIWFSSILLFQGSVAISTLRKKRYLILFVFLLFYFFSSILSVGVLVAFNRIIAMLELCSPVLMYDIFKMAKKSVKVFTIIMFFAILLYNTEELISVINLYGFGLRDVVTLDDDVYLKNAFNWVYSWVFISMAAVLLLRMTLLKGRKKWWWILFLVLSFLGVYIIIRSLFMTAILLVLTGCLLSFIYGRKKWIVKSIAAMIIGIILFVISFNVFLNYIGLMEHGGDFLTERAGEVYNTIIGEKGSSHDLDARNDLSTISLRTFASHPLFGINHKVTDFSKVQYTMVGDHSEWLDSLALYGLFALLFFSFLIQTAKHGQQKGMPIYIMYFITGFLNPLWYFPQNVIVFYFLPIIIGLFDHNKDVPFNSHVGYTTI